MPRTTPEGIILSEFENAVLDPFHKTLPLWSRPRPESRLALLAAFDALNALIPASLLMVDPNVHTVQQAKWVHDSLGYALQFLWREERSMAVGGSISQELFDEATEFLSHCKDYSIVADFHMGFNRGLYRLEADGARRRVRFVPDSPQGSAPHSLGMIESHHKEWDRIDRARETRMIGKEVLRLLRSLPRRSVEGRLVIDDIEFLKSPVFDQALPVCLPPELIPVDSDADLGGMTVGEFRRMWQALSKWSMAAVLGFMDAIMSGKPQVGNLPTQVVPKDQFLRTLGAMSDMPPASVTLFVERLSFGHGCRGKAPDIMLQPLLNDGETVAWSPSVIQVSRHERNHLKLLSRLPKLDATAANLIGNRERMLCRMIGEHLGKFGFQFKTRIQLPDGVGEIDLLAYHDKHPEEILVIEAKAVLEVDEVNEVNAATDEMIGGQRQLRKAINLLSGMPMSELARLWSKPQWGEVKNHFGLVCTPEAQPNPRYDHREFPAICFETLQAHFRDHALKSPRKIWTAAVKKPWVMPFDEVSYLYKSLSVGDVTYEIPMMVIEENDLAP